MDLIPHIKPDGTAVFYARCPVHNWYFKGQPPLTTGCRECWLVYFFAQMALSPESDKQALADQLESAIRHTAEMVDSGEWDFEPYERAIIEIEKED